MGGIQVHTDNERIWLLRYPEEFRVGDYRALFEDIRSMNPKGLMHTVLIDFSATSPWSASAEIRREAGEVLKANVDYLEKYTVAEARVSPNKIGRGILTVFDWINPQPWKTNTFATGPNAELWLRGRLENAGIEVPEQPAWFDPERAESA